MKTASIDRFAIEEATVGQIHKAIQDKRLTCLELVDGYLDRIAAYDRKGPALHAILAINAAARDTAGDKDAEFQTSGRLDGPLHGIPVAVKDNCNTIDMPTTGGSQALAGVVPDTESTVTRKLREAGAIILAKTNLHEFALSGTTTSSLGGQTKNPYDLSRTPGGSSGGTGVAVAANFATLGVGTDTVNSIRSPASANCLVGFRPTRGLVSRAGIMPVSSTQDSVGPLTRSVRDAAVMLDVIAGFDPADPVSARCVGKIPRSYGVYLDEDGLCGARIGVFRSFLGTGAQHQCVNQAIAAAVDTLHKAGATVVDINDASFDADAILDSCDVQKWEFKAQFNEYLGTLPAGAPLRTLGDIILSSKFHKPSLHKFLLEANAYESPLQEPEYLSRLVQHDKLRDRLFLLMARQKVDVLIYPLQKCLVVPIGKASQVDRNGILAAVTGFPSVTVPVGFAMGVPIGMDMLARPFDEPVLFKCAYAFEQATQWRKPAPQTRWPQ